MKRLLTSLPIWFILADMLYGFALNISQSQKTPNISSSIVTPDIAFSGLQIISNGGMILIVGFGLIILLQLNRTVLSKQILPIGIFRTLGLLAVLAFSVPSLWEWLWVIYSFITGTNHFNISNIRYFITSLCMPLISLLCLYRLYGWYRLNKVQFTSANTGI
ncbi:hypothetical protein J2T38_002284 [Neisseria perflava]|uniref:hypothetical protein n=1 Tax=Neisseria perflava TaxID=33053 RepID=UPI00209FA950|nr:hypothetical protein [Neisseria perflava]MCP1773430.1 hypothetical protein [Neisseria perflava]